MGETEAEAFGSKIEDLEMNVYDSGFTVQGFGCRVQSFMVR